MKVLLGFIIFFAILNAFAAESNTLLLQDKETDELILVKNGLLEKALQKPAGDDELSELDSDFSLPEWVVAEVRGGGSIMVLRGGAAIGVQTLGGHLEAGVDTGAMFIMAGTDGAISPELGAYVKYRLTPDK